MKASTAKSIVSGLMVDPCRMVLGLWSRRDLVWQFTHRNIELRHRGSRLGALWALLNPLSMLALYFVVFGLIYDQRFRVVQGETRYDYSLALFLSLTLFHAFAETLAFAPSIIISNPNFVKKVVFPLEILPVAQVGSAMFHLAVGLALVLVGSLFGTIGLGWQALWLPVLMVPLLMLSLGVSWLLAALGVFVRDIGQVTAFVSTALLFGSAVMYPPSQIGPRLWPVLRLNPVLQMIDLVRGTVLWHQPLAWEKLAYIYAIGGGILVGGAVFFALMRRSFAEVI